MTRFIVKSIIVFLLFILVTTYLTEQEHAEVSESAINEQAIVLHSADLYNKTKNDHFDEPIEQVPVDDQQSIPYQIAQWIEQSGLLIYEGIITVVTDLAKII